ncbi:Amino-acid carrier protein AlsT [Oligella ureolytica]|nr:sodium:alanine symporter family protein [Oligella sp.]
MDSLNVLLNQLSGIVWGPITLILIVGCGIWLTFRLGFLQFRYLPFALKQIFKKHPVSVNGQNCDGDISQFGALMTALSATIGTGNIAGVATAVVLGGPGAVFWMWITAVFGMATKYAEAILAVKYRVVNSKGEMSGGPMYYIERGLNMKWLAMIFAVLGTLASFGIGSSVQSNSVASAVEQSYGVGVWVTGITLTIFTAFVLLGGIKSISRASSVIVPFMAVIYVAGGLWIMVANIELVGPAFAKIFTLAWGNEAVAGGLIGAIIRYGVARGVFSNEAGMGSAPIAAAAAKTDHPARQAFVSMTGTFIDTIIVCTITGVVLVMGLEIVDAGGLTGAALTTFTFDALLPGAGADIVALGLIFFAYSTILGWSYYGEKCATYAFGDSITWPYRIIYTASVLIGAVIHLDLVWAFADIFNGLMALPNVIGLFLLTGVVVKETNDFFEKRRMGLLP